MGNSRASSLFLCAALAGCGVSNGNHQNGDGGPNGGSDMGPPPDLAPIVWNDFPSAPIIDSNAPPGSAGLFGPATSGNPTGGPCMLDPELGTLFPQNWLRPRFHFTAPAGQTLFEIRLHADHEMNDLVVYTTQTTWTMDAATWNNLSNHVVDEPITVTVRGAPFDGVMLTGMPSIGSSGPITVAPASAAGAIVYWTTTNGTALRGFTIGDETVHTVLVPSQASTACVGCHSSTPDGDFVAFSASNNAGNGDPAFFGLRSVDGAATTPSWLSSAAQTLLGRTYQELPVFSKSHWQTGDRVGLSMLLDGSFDDIIWTDLEATVTDQNVAWGVLARDGDPGHPFAASFSHDGQNVLYTSSASGSSGVTVPSGDLRIIPYNNRMGGTSTAVTGASDMSYNEFYPTFAPDDQWIAFDRLPTGQSSYNNSSSEVFVIPSAGGSATRLAANDPPTCSGQVSPGLTNSWPKWAPDATTVGSKTYYWLAFSSKRGDTGTLQIYVAPVVVDGGTVLSYPALYLWNQPANENNHTPAWDNFQIPLG